MQYSSIPHISTAARTIFQTFLPGHSIKPCQIARFSRSGHSTPMAGGSAAASVGSAVTFAPAVASRAHRHCVAWPTCFGRVTETYNVIVTAHDELAASLSTTLRRHRWGTKWNKSIHRDKMEYDEPEGPKWNISPQNDPKWNSEISTEVPNRNISPKMEYLGVE